MTEQQLPPIEVTMPPLGESVSEGTITRWLKRDGDEVFQDEPLFEVSTDKVDTEIGSPGAGFLKIGIAEGETVEVNAVVGHLLASGPAGGSTPQTPDTSSGDGPKEEPLTVASSDGDSGVGDHGSERLGTQNEESIPEAPKVAKPVAGAPIVASPVVRMLSNKLGVSLDDVVGTGLAGRVTRRDLLGKGLSSQSASPAAVEVSDRLGTPARAGSTGQVEEAVQMSRVRKSIASHMHASLQTSARAWTVVEVNFEQVVSVREAAKDSFQHREGIPLTYTSFMARAVAEALMAFPYVNAELRGDEIILKHYVNLGIAVSYDEGLIVPVISGADALSLIGLQRAIADLSRRARTHDLSPQETSGGTFTITNPGPYGSFMSLPIIAQPQTAILAFDAIQKRPVEVNGAIGLRHMANVSLSWDHRVIDGALATRFLTRVKHNLETWDFSQDL